MRGQNVIRAGLFVAYVATVPVANWLVDRFGVVPVGFGLRAPAAVYLVGLAFTLRDLLQEWAGRRFVVVGILCGALLSFLVASPGLALDSVVFLQLAFGSLEFLPGQVLGKAVMTVVALPLLAFARRSLLPPRAPLARM